MISCPHTLQGAHAMARELSAANSSVLSLENCVNQRLLDYCLHQDITCQKFHLQLAETNTDNLCYCWWAQNSQCGAGTQAARWAKKNLPSKIVVVEWEATRHPQLTRTYAVSARYALLLGTKEPWKDMPAGLLMCQKQLQSTIKDLAGPHPPCPLLQTGVPQRPPLVPPEELQPRPLQGKQWSWP